MASRERVTATTTLLARRLWVEHAPLLIIVGIYVASRYGLWLVTRIDALAPTAPDALNVVYWPMLGVGAVVFMTVHMLRMMLVDRDTGGLLARETWRRFVSEYLVSYRCAAALLVLGLYTLLAHTFSAFKRAIPSLQPFYLDERLAEIDRFLHFGQDPWAILHPIVGHPLATLALQFIYTSGWFAPLSGMILLAAWAKDRELRAQLLLTLVVSWIVVGSAMATVLSSVGPCFYELVTGAGDFRPLMSYLEGVDQKYGLPALGVQRMLWNGHLLGGTGEMGISAMPSMHVGMATLFVLAGWRCHRILGVALGVLGLAILIGSVHLAWHYAVDGYVSIIVVCLIWWASGRFTRWYSVVHLPEKVPSPS